MLKPYQKELTTLADERVHYEFIVERLRQEHNSFAGYFSHTLEELCLAIRTLETRQAAAVSEWTACPEAQRETILAPIQAAAEQAVILARSASCPEMARYLDHLFTELLTELEDPE